MRIRRTSMSARAALLCLAAIALVCTELATASTADAAERTIYFRDGLGASARVTYNVVSVRRQLPSCSAACLMTIISA